jgi:DNA mismatch repair protein MutS2
VNTSLRSLDFAEVLEMVALEARTAPGRRRVLARRPVHALGDAERLQSELAEMTRLVLEEGMLPLGGLGEAPETIDAGALDLEASWQILRAVRATQALREAILRSDREMPHLEAIASEIFELDDLIRSIGRYFTKDGKLREDASPELRRIRSRIHGRRQETQRVLGDLMNRRADAIQEPIITVRGDRYCIPVKSERRSDVPGILHERSGSGASVFLEPMEIVELNNEIADLLLAERDEIRRIERFIAEQIILHRDPIIASVGSAAELDAVQACAIVGSRVAAVRPLFNDRHELRIREGRHPLLDERLAGLRASAFGEEPSERKVVPVTVELSGDERGLVVSGPNAGGKTVTLKTVGLLTAMAASGLPVPAADGTTLPLPDQIHLLIGDDQALLEHLSTFSAYMTRLESILASTSPDSLVLLDEIGSGTDPEEGSAIAAAVIEHLVDTGCLFVVTTHLARVQSLAIASERIVNASMEFGEEEHEPTFRLIPGLPGRSRAIEVAERVGLPRPILDRAREYLGTEHERTDQILAQLQRSLREARARQDELENRAREIAGMERTLEQRLAQAREKEKKLLGRWQEESDAIRTDVYRQLRAEIRALRETDRKERESASLEAIAGRVLEPAGRRAEAAESSPEKPVIGDLVRHRRFRFEGTLASLEGDRASIVTRGKRMEVDAGDLELVSRASASPEEQKRQKPKKAIPDTGAEPAVSAELDLIGQRVEEAIEESDRFLDRALMEGRGAVRIIHGHGSGRLRKALREHLRKHPAVRSWRAGGEREGGDGATIAVLEE